MKKPSKVKAKVSRSCPEEGASPEKEIVENVMKETLPTWNQ